MAKSNKKSEHRKTPRISVNVPRDWHAVLRRLAAKRRQPVIFTIVSLIEAEAEKEGITDLPPAPWEEDSDD